MKFLFFDLLNLDAAMSIADSQFEISFVFERPPPLATQIGVQTFRLHCVPVVNLFSSTANPIRKSAIEHEHLLTAADINPNHMEVYSVDSVTSVGSAARERREVLPFADFTHAAAGDKQAYFTIRRVLSPVDSGINTYFAVVTPRDAMPDTSEETFSIAATFTNRYLPSSLRAGQISVASVSSPPVAQFHNITEVTKPVRPPLNDELYWRLLAHLGLNHASLAQRGVLSAMLELYNFQGIAGHARGRANRMRSESIRSVGMEATRRIFRGMPVRGGQTFVEVEQDKFASEGDAFLFGCVLDALMADHVSMNSFNEFILHLHPSQGEYRWPAKAGMKTII
jgi:type VI secretion system protein ImpG